MEQTKDKGCIVVGNKYSPNTGFDFYILKLDAFWKKYVKKLTEETLAIQRIQLNKRQMINILSLGTPNHFQKVRAISMC